MIIRWKKYLWILIIIAVFFLGTTAGYFYFQKNQANLTPKETEKNIYINFLSEVYDKIQKNYWEKLTDEQLGNLFRAGIEKLIGRPQEVEIKNKQDFYKMLNETIKIVKPDKKKEFATQLANLVLINLKPNGRSALYTVQDKKSLANRVLNINPETDLYKILGVEQGASREDINNAYESKVAETKSKEEIEKLEYAHKVLSDTSQKQRYDQARIEPTVFAELVTPKILHVYIKKMSPTTLDELKEQTEKFVNIEGLNSIIIDLRKNVGGSIDLLPYLLGPFIGKDQYAYEFFHQGEYTPFKTKTGWLPSLIQYKKVVILIDNQAQSSAEVMAAVLKKYNVGVTVGTTTKGWGTIEAVYDIEQQLSEEEKYSMFLVHSLTLRDDNQPIQGRGVDPLISIKDSDWKNQLLVYFNDHELVKAVEEIWNKPPGQF